VKRAICQWPCDCIGPSHDGTVQSLMPGHDRTEERGAIDARPHERAIRGDSEAIFYGRPEETVDTVNSLGLFVSEQTEVDRSDPNLPSPPPVPSVPARSSDSILGAPALGTRDKPLARTAHELPSGNEPIRVDEPSPSVEPPLAVMPAPVPPSRSFLARAVSGIEARPIATRFGQGVAVVALLVLLILGAGDLISRLEDALASSPQPQPAPQTATTPPAAVPASASPEPAPATAAPLSAAPETAPQPPRAPLPVAATVDPPAALVQRAGLKTPAVADPPARETAITSKPARATSASQTSPAKESPPTVPTRTPAPATLDAQRVASAPAARASVPAPASATGQRATTPAVAAQRAATPPSGPARFVGTLKIESQPAGAAVSINGTPIGVTPITLEQQRAGSLAVQITLEGFERWSAAIQVPAGRVTQVNATLRRVVP